MSGEVTVTPGYIFDEENGEQLTLEKLNRALQQMQLQVAALSIDTPQLADASVTSDKLATTISAQLGVPDGSITIAKLAGAFICPVAKGGTGSTTAVDARSALGVVSSAVLVNKNSSVKTAAQTISSTAWADVTDLSVAITPTSAASKVKIEVALSGGATGAFGADSELEFRILRDTTPIALSSSGLSGILFGDMDQSTVLFVDEPALDVEIIYKVQARRGSSTANCYVSRSTASATTVISSILVEEVPV